MNVFIRMFHVWCPFMALSIHVISQHSNANFESLVSVTIALLLDVVKSDTVILYLNGNDSLCCNLLKFLKIV